MPDPAALLDAALAALTNLGLATGVARSATVYVLVSASHVLGIALLVGPIVVADLALLGVLRSLDRAAVATLRATARIGVALALVTGVLLLSAKPEAYVANPAFLAKMAVVAVALANAIAFEVWIGRRATAAGGGPWPPAGRSAGRTLVGAAAAVSLVGWLTTVLLGRWIAFV
jgi:hypothetical protein